MPEILIPTPDPESVRAAVQNGADAVYIALGSFGDKALSEAIKYCRIRGVKVYFALPTALRDGETDALLKKAVRAAELGAAYLHHTLVLSVTPLPDAPSYEQMLSAVLPTAKKIVKRCEEYGMQCLYEPQGMFFNGIAGVSGLLRAVREEYAGVGVCADLGNSLFVDESPLDVTAALIGDARHVHVKDYLCINPPRADLKGHLSRGGVQLVDCRVGEGDCRLAECLALLKNAGYSGAYSIEIDADDDTTRRAMDFVRQNG